MKLRGNSINKSMPDLRREVLEVIEEALVVLLGHGEIAQILVLQWSSEKAQR